MLKTFEFDKIKKSHLKDRLLNKLTDRFKDQIEINKINKSSSTTNQLGSLEERFVFGEITKVQWAKYAERINHQKDPLLKEILDKDKISSNLKKIVEKGLKISENLQQACISSSFESKLKLRYLVFPEGITYCKENDTVLTKRVNSVFAEIPINTGVSTKKQNENSSSNNHSASSVGMTSHSSNFLQQDILELILFMESSGNKP